MACSLCSYSILSPFKNTTTNDHTVMKAIQRIYHLAVAAFVATMILSGISCSSSTSSIPTDEKLISMKNDKFSPATITIRKGEAITWVNDDTKIHTATSDMDEGGWNTGDIAPAAARSIIFHTAGTYPYHCVYHASMGMRGTIIVK